jgi:hypothetical protein
MQTANAKTIERGGGRSGGECGRGQPSPEEGSTEGRQFWCRYVHPKLRSITPVATKVHVILRSFVVVIWMHDNIELV